jgi:glycogen operon protein
MLLMGDEIGRTQRGNNNGYCQDNETSWVDWEIPPVAEGLGAFVRQIIRLRMAHPAFERKEYFRGERVLGSALKDVTWFRTDGQEMTADDWNHPATASVALLIDGQAFDERDALGERVSDDLFCLLFNAESAPLNYTLPSSVWRDAWEVVLDTSADQGPGELAVDATSGRVCVRTPAKTVALLVARRDAAPREDKRG